VTKATSPTGWTLDWNEQPKENRSTVLVDFSINSTSTSFFRCSLIFKLIDLAVVGCLDRLTFAIGLGWQTRGPEQFMLPSTEHVQRDPQFLADI
jgi:hypothetical protein